MSLLTDRDKEFIDSLPPKEREMVLFVTDQLEAVVKAESLTEVTASFSAVLGYLKACGDLYALLFAAGYGFGLEFFGQAHKGLDELGKELESTSIMSRLPKLGE